MINILRDHVISLYFGHNKAIHTTIIFDSQPKFDMYITAGRKQIHNGYKLKSYFWPELSKQFKIFWVPFSNIF